MPRAENLEIRILIFRTALPTLTSDTLPTLQLLNHLASVGYMSGGLINVQGGRWRQALVATLHDRLATNAAEPIQSIDRRVLGLLLRLLSLLPGDGREFAPSIVTLLRTFGQFDDGAEEEAIEEWQTAGPWNNAHMLSSLLECAGAYISDEEVQRQFDALLVTEGGAKVLLRKWNWNAEVMKRLIEVVTQGDLTVQYVTSTLERKDIADLIVCPRASKGYSHHIYSLPTLLYGTPYCAY